MSKDGIVSYVKDEKKFLSEIHLATFSTHKYLYIPKPFDVRQAMLDRPNEWVGAFLHEENWYKVGFDSDGFVAVMTYMNGSEVVDENIWGVSSVSQKHLEICIPIEDVPEEATR